MSEKPESAKSAVAAMRREPSFVEDEIAERLAASPSPPAGGGEPVAWQGRSEDGRAWEEVKDPDYFRRCGWQVRPLYTSPDAAQQRIRELEEPTEDVIEFVARAIHDTDDMADTTWPDGEGDDGYRGDRAYVRLCPNPEAFRQAARQAISAYHEAIRARTAPGGGHE